MLRSTETETVETLCHGVVEPHTLLANVSLTIMEIMVEIHQKLNFLIMLLGTVISDRADAVSENKTPCSQKRYAFRNPFCITFHRGGVLSFEVHLIRCTNGATLAPIHFCCR